MSAPLASRLGVQLYMLGAELKADLPGVLRRLAAAGYREVETSPLAGVAPEELRRELDRAGLACTSIHISMEDASTGALTLAAPAAVIGFAQALGARHAVVSVFPILEKLLARPEGRAALGDERKLAAGVADVAASMTREDWIGVAQRLNEGGAALAAAGVRLAYHNHNAEFVAVEEGRSALDLIMDHTDPALVDLDLDVGWAKAAGIDPVHVLQRHRARIALVHLKDLSETSPNTRLSIQSAEMGEGVQAWELLFEAMRTAPIRHAFVEQEPPHKISGLTSAEQAFAFLQPGMAHAGL